MTNLVPHTHAWDGEGYCVVCGARNNAPTPRTDAIWQQQGREDRTVEFANLCEQLERELAQALRDAQRYAALMTWAINGGNEGLFCRFPSFQTGCATPTKELLDSLIDAAMAAEKPKP